MYWDSIRRRAPRVWKGPENRPKDDETYSESVSEMHLCNKDIEMSVTKTFRKLTQVTEFNALPFHLLYTTHRAELGLRSCMCQFLILFEFRKLHLNLPNGMPRNSCFSLGAVKFNSELIAFGHGYHSFELNPTGTLLWWPVWNLKDVIFHRFLPWPFYCRHFVTKSVRNRVNCFRQHYKFKTISLTLSIPKSLPALKFSIF